MNSRIVCASALAIMTTMTTISATSYASDKTKLISQQDAIDAALSALEVEVLGIRYDKPDTQWDVFIKSGKSAYEVEINALTGKVVATEEESLAEVRAELAGDLSHEGVAGDVD